MTRSHGFSLIELMIAVAISLVLVLIASGVYLGSSSAYYGMQQRSSLSQDALMLVDYLRNELMPAGGGSVRAWMGIWVEDNCSARSVFPNCGGSDRLTISASTYPLQECGITAMAGVNVLQIAFSAPGVCCMQPVNPGEISFLNQSVILVNSASFANKYSTNVDLNLCQLTVQPGQAAGWDQGVVANWSGGTVTLVNVETLFLDSAKTLNRFVDTNGNGIADPGETAAVAVGVIDFQIALGYDFNPADGRITTNPGGINDEWLYNAVGESYGAGVFIAPFTKAALLLVSPAVILGVLNPSALTTGPTTYQVLNGPARSLPGWALRAEVTQLAPRNSYVFQ